MNTRNQEATPRPTAQAGVFKLALRPKMAEVFGFHVPISDYYLHRGHTWVVVESREQVRVGMDEFSQKILGPADGLQLPELGKKYYQDHVCMAVLRQGKKASVMAPIDGTIEAINPKVCDQPNLVHDDPYEEGWLFVLKPTNLDQNLENLFYGETCSAWIDQEAHKLLNLMDTAVGVTLPDGGSVIDDVFGHYPELGWRRLVQEFFLTHLTKSWKKRY